MSDPTAAPQEALDLPTTNGRVEDISRYVFEPIKGYPMLNWRGKRPFTSTAYYPAQLKEVHGSENDEWRNKIYWGDNLQVMSHLLKEYRGEVDLTYIDPPFDSRVDYAKKIVLRGEKAASDPSNFEEKQYTDLWSNDEYLQFMYERLVLIRELMSEHGVILVHVDWHKSHYIRCLLDEIFGAANFLNELIWKYDGPGAPSSTKYGSKHDAILRYSKNVTALAEKAKASAGYDMYTDVFVADGESTFDKDKAGRYYFTLPRGDYSDESIERLRAEGRVLDTSNGNVRIKYFVKKVDGGFLKREKLQDVWSDIPSLGLAANSAENTKYPTQKPERLLERLIASSSPVGGLVFDCFMGSGTTQAVAMRLGRRFIGADINLGAIQTTTKRLLRVAAELPKDRADVSWPSFEIYNVNQYDIFRNPLQAKELLLQALEVQKLELKGLFDGEKDGRLVKIMPVNRIATRADLGELVAGFDYKAWERRQQSLPGQPVERIMLVCMGHEPDLKAQLELEVKPFKIDVKVVDVLRDKADLEFRRDSEARLSIKRNELVIERFYPLNLMQKLSLQKQSVEDWREMADSVLIDWNYDGAVFQPTLVDVPEKNNLVAGRYSIPSQAGTIRVKITDLLSESWEGSIQRA